MLRKMRLCSLIIFVSLFAAACGQKGALYKSPDKQDNQTEEQQQPKKQSNKE
ncbi:lipoprotein [Shewanella eurypsychrophilus]|uniref:Lipoprotein n=1 Tax=Shewanella eurypsychrophilus TaxID=2593656 RepID=A0ABX8S506_9GAMM|nr:MULTISPECIES: lipoprotein [Shewanella]QXP45020.1 lipoprotein [Shewanella eurypsychrophilus]